MKRTTQDVFYSEEHDDLDMHLKVEYDHGSGEYIVSGLTGEDAVRISEDDLEGRSSVAAYQNALEETVEEDESESKEWSHEELKPLI